MPQRRFIEIDHLRLSFLEQGKPTAGSPTLLMLHGLMGCADTFVPLLEALPLSVHAIVLDLPGAGQSERRSDADATLGGSAALVRKFIEACGLRQVRLLGHSHGGAVAMQLARTSPESVEQLILLAPAHPYFREGDPLIRFYLSLPGRLFAYSMPWYPEWLQLLGLRRMAGPRSWDSLERLKPYRDNIRTQGTIRHLLRLLSSWQEDMAELRTLLRRPIQQPTLLLWGDSDRAVPLGSAPALCAHLAACELHVLQGVGHRPAEEEPQRVAAMMWSWMKHGTISRYSPNSAASQSRTAALMTPSFDAGD